MPLFARYGFAGVTTRQIVKAAGVSEPILYRHFAGKRALYDALEAHYLGSVPDRRDRLRALPSDTQTLIASVHFLLDTLVRSTGFDPARHDALKRMLQGSAIADGRFAREMMKAQYMPLHDKLVACLESAEAAGDLVAMDVPFSLRVHLVHHMTAQLTTYRLPSPPVLDYGTDDLAALVEQVCRCAFRTLGLTEAAVARYHRPAPQTVAVYARRRAGVQ
jgi:AcrR family transcriptional regulator